MSRIKPVELGVGALPASKVGAPLIDGCVAWADPRAFKGGRWSFDGEELKTIHYIAGGNFFSTGTQKCSRKI